MPRTRPFITLFCGIMFAAMPVMANDDNSQFARLILPADNVVAPAPEVAAVHRFQDFPVNFSSGTAGINVPLFSWNVGSYDFDLSLSYQIASVLPDGYWANGGYTTHYRDCLGAVRATVTGGRVEAGVDYYPYGTPFADSRGLATATDRRLFGDKELMRFNSYNTYDYTARQYPATTATFDTPDPLCEQHPWISNYTFCSGNPIARIDPSGMTDFVNHKGEVIGNDGVDNNKVSVVKATEKQMNIDNNGPVSGITAEAQTKTGTPANYCV